MIRFRNLKRNLHVLHNNTQNVYITFHCMLGGYKVLDVFSILDFPPLPSSAGTGTGQITDAMVQVNYRTLDYSQEYFLKIRMKR